MDDFYVCNIFEEFNLVWVKFVKVNLKVVK